MTFPNPAGEIGGQCSQATKEDLKRQRIKCRWTTCNSRALFEDWTGARYCLFHSYYTIRWGGGRIWSQVKRLRIYWKGLLP